MTHLPEPNKKIPYPIAHDDKGGSLFIYDGSSSSSTMKHDDRSTSAQKRVVLCCPGFPDDHAAFIPLASRLAQEEGCCVGVICLPGFDDRPEEDKPWTDHWKDGYTMEEMVLAFQEGAKALLQEATSDSALTATKRRAETIDYTVILHDWGVPVGMIQINRAVEAEKTNSPSSAELPPRHHVSLVPNQVVIMDLGLPFHPDDKGKPKLRSPLWPDDLKFDFSSLYVVTTEILYRLLFITMFVLQRYVSRVLAILVFAVGSQITIVTGLVPSKRIDNQLIRDRKPNPLRLAYMSYPYCNVAKTLVAGKRRDVEHHATLPVLDAMPVLFLYGLEKNIMFHDDKLIDCLKDIETQGGRSRSVAVDQGGHWFHLQQPETTYRVIRKFLLQVN